MKPGKVGYEGMEGRPTVTLFPSDNEGLFATRPGTRSATTGHQVHLYGIPTTDAELILRGHESVLTGYVQPVPDQRGKHQLVNCFGEIELFNGEKTEIPEGDHITEYRPQEHPPTTS